MKHSELYKLVFGEDIQRERYKMKDHNFKLTICGKRYCSGCGLVALRNTFTQWAVNKGCLHDLHPDFKRQCAKAGGYK